MKRLQHFVAGKIAKAKQDLRGAQTPGEAYNSRQRVAVWEMVAFLIGVKNS